MTIEILSNGALNLVQDLGRPDHVGIGVSSSGAMDVPALILANSMLGNPADAAGIEISIFPFRLRFLEAANFASAGASTTVAVRGRSWPSWWTAHADAGDILTIEPPPDGGRVYLAMSGGIDVPCVLGSRSTDLKSGFGGFEGRGLLKGDRLSSLHGGLVGAASLPSRGIAPQTRIAFSDELKRGTVTIRTMAGAELHRFNKQAIAAFTESDFRLTPDCNRQGYRLEGEVLALDAKVELLSHGIVPGTIQVPPSGQPIIQMAEANTCGGYPKIATVIEADLWRLAQLRPGLRVRFTLVDQQAALAAKRALDEELARFANALAVAGVPAPALLKHKEIP
ncbi:biotin-dependent carboxyltransferase family protein [Acidovorax sp. ACV01]|uniref:5-oxoprolinase subunit C family protein n=1 Tax=Acidovorax sp. ACV01 TaxID=2769311 RepID=UPI00351C6E34